MDDSRIAAYCAALEQMKLGQFTAAQAIEAENDDIGLLGQTIKSLGLALDHRFREMCQLARISEKINAGLVLDEVLEHVFAAFSTILPYDRIGVSLIEQNGRMVRARWAKAKCGAMELTTGYEAPLAGSSLQQIIDTGHPRIINDLEQYLAERPNSASTRLILSEGIRASLTCPLFALEKPIGFIFFSSKTPGAYHDAHVELFQELAVQLSLAIEKSRLYQQVVELNRLKDRFIGFAAHDLRGPITAIRGFLELLSMGDFGPVTDDQRDIFELLKQNCDSMLLLVNDLLDAQAIQSGTIDLHITPVQLMEQLTGAIAFHRGLARLKSISLEVQCPPLPIIRCDPQRIRQVLDNLLSNAIKYSFPQTVITVSADMTCGNIAVSVRDQGQGIPEHELPKLFTEFGRTSTRPTGDEPSHGLGLAIVKRIVEAHGGRVWVQSAAGQGSTFSFCLPQQDHCQQCLIEAANKARL